MKTLLLGFLLTIASISFASLESIIEVAQLKEVQNLSVQLEQSGYKLNQIEDVFAGAYMFPQSFNEYKITFRRESKTNDKIIKSFKAYKVKVNFLGNVELAEK